MARAPAHRSSSRSAAEIGMDALYARFVKPGDFDRLKADFEAMSQVADSLALFRVPIDERLTAAMRHDHSRPGQLEIALESQLTPREIQTRIRAGHSVDEVSLAAGISPLRCREP